MHYLHWHEGAQTVLAGANYPVIGREAFFLEIPFVIHAFDNHGSG